MVRDHSLGVSAVPLYLGPIRSRLKLMWLVLWFRRQLGLPSWQVIPGLCFSSLRKGYRLIARVILDCLFCDAAPHVLHSQLQVRWHFRCWFIELLQFLFTDMLLGSEPRGGAHNNCPFDLEAILLAWVHPGHDVEYQGTGPPGTTSKEVAFQDGYLVLPVLEEGAKVQP